QTKTSRRPITEEIRISKWRMNLMTYRSKLMKQILVLIIMTLLVSCKEDYILKPNGQVRLEYPEPEYGHFDSDCPFTFEYSKLSKVTEKEKPCWFVLHYPDMKANIYLTYFEINGKEDLAVKIKDSEKFVQEQTVKA